METEFTVSWEVFCFVLFCFVLFWLLSRVQCTEFVIVTKVNITLCPPYTKRGGHSSNIVVSKQNTARKYLRSYIFL